MPEDAHIHIEIGGGWDNSASCYSPLVETGPNPLLLRPSCKNNSSIGLPAGLSSSRLRGQDSACRRTANWDLLHHIPNASAMVTRHNPSSGFPCHEPSNHIPDGSVLIILLDVHLHLHRAGAKRDKVYGKEPGQSRGDSGPLRCSRIGPASELTGKGGRESQRVTIIPAQPLPLRRRAYSRTPQRPESPRDWQGSLPYTYHVGPGPVK